MIALEVPDKMSASLWQGCPSVQHDSQLLSPLKCNRAPQTDLVPKASDTRAVKLFFSSQVIVLPFTNCSRVESYFFTQCKTLQVRDQIVFVFDSRTNMRMCVITGAAWAKVYWHKKKGFLDDMNEFIEILFPSGPSHLWFGNDLLFQH